MEYVFHLLLGKVRKPISLSWSVISFQTSFLFLQLPTNWSVLLSYVWISSLTASGIHPLPVSSLSFEVETGLADDEVDVAGEGAAGCLSRIIGIIPGVQWPFWTIVGFIKWSRIHVHVSVVSTNERWISAGHERWIVILVTVIAIRSETENKIWYLM